MESFKRFSPQLKRRNMKKSTYGIWISLVLGFGGVSCSQTSTQPQPAPQPQAAAPAPAPAPVTAVLDCAFPESPTTAAPVWVCDAPVEGVAVSAVGSFRKTGAGVQFQKTQATAAARNALAANMKIYVKQLIKNYSETTGTGDSETVDTVSSDVSKQITDATLEGSKVFRSIVDPNTGTMYVLVGFDPAQAAQASKESIKSSMNNDQALWQKFQAQKSHDELDAELAKQADMEAAKAASKAAGGQ